MIKILYYVKVVSLCCNHLLWKELPICHRKVAFYIDTLNRTRQGILIHSLSPFDGKPTTNQNTNVNIERDTTILTYLPRIIKLEDLDHMIQVHVREELLNGGDPSEAGGVGRPYKYSPGHQTVHHSTLWSQSSETVLNQISQNGIQGNFFSFIIYRFVESDSILASVLCFYVKFLKSIVLLL